VDEPIGAMSLKESFKVMHVLREIANSGVTVVASLYQVNKQRIIIIIVTKSNFFLPLS
jgi:ABC-type phosphate/phosphonate transport system ATPase subunit